MKGQPFLVAFVLIFFAGTSIVGASTGKIVGVVKDAQTGEPLPGANVFLQGTALGAATNLKGEYLIPAVPVGEYVLVVTYIGYKKVTKPISVMADQVTRQDVKLQFEVIEGQAVVVTAQLEGQARAINQQLSANTIVNVVSSDKIKELPDQNAAESLGRLPGISIQRDAGEGTKVVIRGLSPKFNSITVNGERIPSTEAVDRSVDLSMISPDMLAGIEVFKALTPDKDGDAIGGMVNFVIRKAPAGMKTDFRFQGGYNNHESDYGVYKGSASLSNRFYEDKLGVVLTGNLQRANRSSDVLEADYSFAGQGVDRAKIKVEDLNLGDRLETRDRFGASLALDYDLGNGAILLNSFWNRTERDEIARRKRYRVGTTRVEYDLTDRRIETTLLTNSLSGEHNFKRIALSWRASYSGSKQDMPFSHYARFREDAAYTADLIEDQGPELIPLGAKNNLAETYFKNDHLDEQLVKDRDWTAQLDVKMPLTLGTRVSGYFKFGGKIRDKDRTRDDHRMWTSHFNLDALGREMTANPDRFRNEFRYYELTNVGRLGLNGFLDPGFSAGDYLNGQFAFGPGLSVEKVRDFLNTFRSFTLSNGNPLYVVDDLYDLRDYKAGEQIRAAYLMAELNLGRKLTLLGGARYEWTENDYKSIFGTPEIGEDGHSVSGVTDTTGVRQYDEILPMAHLRYKFTSWCDIRLAATKTLSRPDYFNLVPRESINNDERVIERGEPNLKPTRVWNYDAYLSFYSRLGLFTVGGFYKELRDIDYLRRFPILEVGHPYRGYDIIGPINGKGKPTIKGWEVDLQTNLKFLPSPLDGVVLYANYSRITSETFYPFFRVETKLIPTPPYVISTAIDTLRSGRVVGQADYIANFAVGYEKRGFSGRLSLIAQGGSLESLGGRSEFDGFADDFLRWDLTLQQKITSGFSAFLNFNNITDYAEKAFLGIKAFPTSEEFFGWTADFGLRYKF
jgi:TonB-dependent receptor